MKKLLFFLLALGAFQAKAQVIKGSVDLRDSTISRSIPFEVKPDTKSVKYSVKVYAAAGQVTITVIDPNDKKSHSVTTGNKAGNGHNGPAKSELFENVYPTIPGTWKFNISTENATGTISYQIELIKP